MRLTFVLFITVLFLSTSTVFAASENEQAPEQKGAFLIGDVWGRFDVDIALHETFQEDLKTKLRVAPVFSGILSYTKPGSGLGYSLLTGLQIGNRRIDFAPLFGINIAESRGISGVVGWRLWARPHHFTIWSEGLFYLLPGQEPAKSEYDFLGQLEAVYPIDHGHRFEAGIKALVEGNVLHPHDEMSALGGALIQFWALNPPPPLEERRTTKMSLRFDLAAKVGGCWRQENVLPCFELEGEAVLYLGN